MCPIGQARSAAGDLLSVPEYLCGVNRIIERHRRRFLAGKQKAGGSDRLLSWLFSSGRQT
ncbi:MAG: hypothetical protein EHM13_15770 [Acidobacteria bacterium]|nr:MAG: hypothetical protein EHM13_15770 [Acidobacteriota bacterium]